MQKASRFLSSRATLGAKDVAASVKFYTETLGFEVETTMGDPPSFAILRIDDTGLGLVKTDSPTVESFACVYFTVEGVEALHARCVAANAVITNSLTRHPWGNYDFVVQDPDGHMIALGEEG